MTEHDYMDAAQRMLTKTEILEGSNRKLRTYLPNLGGYVTFRPLNAGEKARVDKLRNKGLIIEMNRKEGASLPSEGDSRKMLDMFEPHMQMNLQDSQEGQEEAKWFAIACALSVGDESWTPDEAKLLNPEDAEQFVQEVYKASGVNTRSLDQFREDAGGAGHSEAPTHGLPTGPHANGAN